MEKYYSFEKIASGYSGLLVGPNHWARDTAQDLGLKFLSTEEMAKQRIELGPYHQISWTGSRLTDSIVVNRDQFFLVKTGVKSPLYDGFAGEYHSVQEEILFEDVTVSETLRIENESFTIPTEELADHEVGQFLFGATVEAYADWLKEIKISYLPFMLPPVSLTKHHEIPFIRPLAMRCTDNWSGLISINDLHLAYGYRCFTAALPEAIDVEQEEVFSEEALRDVRAIFELEPKDYSLAELQAHCFSLGKIELFGLALRLIRHKSVLPVSHATFAPEE